MTPRERAIIAAGFLTQAVAIGATIGAYSLFVKPVGDEFGATRLQMSLGISFMTLMLGATGILVGGLLDRGSIRRVMLVGTVWITACLVLAANATTLWQLGAVALLVGAGIPTLGPLTTMVLIGKSFDATRGRALGLANMGVPVGGFVFALIAGQTLERIGWRGTLWVFAGLLAVISTAAILGGVPKRLEAGSAANSTAPSGGAQPDTDWPPSRLLRTRDFLAVAGCFGIALGTNAGWGAHVAAYLAELGASTGFASAVVALSIGGGLIGGLTFGTLTDSRRPRSLAFVILGLQLGCFAVLWLAPGLIASSVAAAIAGASGGGFIPVLAALVAQRFGTDSMGRALGVSNLFILPFGFGVPIVVGALRDASGDYRASLLVVLGLVVTAAASLSLATLHVAETPALPADS